MYVLVIRIDEYSQNVVINTMLILMVITPIKNTLIPQHTYP